MKKVICNISNTCLKKVVEIEIEKNKNPEDPINQIASQFFLRTDQFTVDKDLTIKKIQKCKGKYSLTLTILNPAQNITFVFHNFRVLLLNCINKSYDDIINQFRIQKIYFSPNYYSKLKLKLWDIDIPLKKFKFNCIPEETFIHVEPVKSVILNYNGFTFICTENESISEIKQFILNIFKFSNEVFIKILPNNIDVSENDKLYGRNRYKIEIYSYFNFLQSNKCIFMKRLDYFTTVFQFKNHYNQIFGTSDQIMSENIIVHHPNQREESIDGYHLIDVLTFNKNLNKYVINFDITCQQSEKLENNHAKKHEDSTVHENDGKKEPGKKPKVSKENPEQKPKVNKENPPEQNPKVSKENQEQKPKVNKENPSEQKPKAIKENPEQKPKVSKENPPDQKTKTDKENPEQKPKAIKENLSDQETRPPITPSDKLKSDHIDQGDDGLNHGCNSCHTANPDEKTCKIARHVSKSRFKPKIIRTEDDEEPQPKPKPEKKKESEELTKYSFKYENTIKCIKLQSDSILIENEPKIKEMFQIESEESLHYSIVNDDEEQSEPIDAKKCILKSFKDKVIELSIQNKIEDINGQSKIMKKYKYQINNDSKTYEIELDSQAKIINMKESIAELKNVQNISNIKILFAGKDLLNDIVIDSLNIESSILFVYIRSEEDVLLMTAKALRLPSCTPLNKSENSGE